MLCILFGCCLASLYLLLLPMLLMLLLMLMLLMLQLLSPWCCTLVTSAVASSLCCCCCCCLWLQNHCLLWPQNCRCRGCCITADVNSWLETLLLSAAAAACWLQDYRCLSLAAPLLPLLLLHPANILW
jgi:hypothetical protein